MTHVWDFINESDLSSTISSQCEQQHRTNPQPFAAGTLQKDHISQLMNQNWEQVLAWTAFHATDVQNLRDAGGQSALHYAILFKAPAYIVDALLYASPELASATNLKGELPIHFAVRLECSNETLKLLLEMSPTCGCVPDYAGNSALSLLWERHRGSLMRKRNGKGKGWNRMMLIIQSNYYALMNDTNHQDSDFLVVHGAICRKPTEL